MSLTLGELAERVGAELHGDANCRIDAVAALQNASAGTISFLANPGYRRYLRETGASAVILRRADLDACPVNALLSENPYATFARVAELLAPLRVTKGGIDPGAVISPLSRVAASARVGPHCVLEDDVLIGEGVEIGPGCFIGHGSSIGAHSRLWPNVTVCHGVHIGERAMIHPGVVIGSDGFGMANDGGNWVKIPQLGGVRIGNDVEIGANTTIDRGALDDTVIEDGVKLDNQIQVAHNVRIGAHTAIAGCVGISGSARIGQHCMIGGGVGIVGHLEITDRVVVTGMTMVTRSIETPGVYSSGLPAQPNAAWNRICARLRGIDDMARRLGALERKTKAAK
jgi:UDP-3-O-[3-hydroxymyristoyl] glucosamine N-acyltransferase